MARRLAATSAISAPPVARCVITDIDLDALAIGYRHRRLTEAARQRALRAISGLERGSTTLDIGGGPGDHAAVFRSRGMQAIVVDPSLSMTGVRKAAVAVCAPAERLPFADSIASLAYFHLSLHYCDIAAAFAESSRVLQPDGRVVVWTMSPQHHESSLLNRWFPTVGEVDAERFATPALIAERLRDSGFEDVESTREVESCARSVADLEASIRAGFVSSLQYVPAGELADGLVAFRRRHSDPDEVIDYTIDMSMVSGRRNSE